MTGSRRRPDIGVAIFFVLAVVLGFYFTFAAVQGDYGVFRRIEAQAEKDRLTEERDALRLQVAAMENMTRRLSDSYLDLDLLDERARDVLGLVRADEIVIN